MRTWYIEEGENTYYCPYCHTETKDWTGDEVETHTEYCTNCSQEYIVEVI